MSYTKNYILITNFILFFIILCKFLLLINEKTNLFLFMTWVIPILIFVIPLNKRNARPYQWFCFLLLIYFLSSSLKVFGIESLFLNKIELFLISVCFFHCALGPRIFSAR